MIEGSLEVKLPTIWTDEKQSRAEAERRERLEERRSEKRKSQKKEDADVRKGRKVAKHCVFPMIWGSGGSKSRLAKAAGAEPAGQMRDEKCTPLWREAHFQVKMYKTPQRRSTFGSCDVEKVHAVVARSKFGSQNVKNTRGSDHFWKLRCRKSARRCGAKHISKSTCAKHTILGRLLEVEMFKKCTPLWREAHVESKCTKHTILGPLLEVEMSKKCTPLWREAHFEVKMLKALGVRTTFGIWDVEKVHAVVARSTFRSQMLKTLGGSDHFWHLRCRKSARRCGAKHISKSNVKNTRGSDHFWRLRCRFAWKAHEIVDLVKSAQNMRVLQHFDKRWQAWDMCRWSAKTHFPWQAQDKTHVHERGWEIRALISWEGLHCGVSEM